MNEQIRQGYKSGLRNWLISLGINLFILTIVMIFTELSYETNDDFAISQEIVAGYPYIGFVNYYLCKILILIQGLFSEMNIFMLSQIIVSFISFCVLIKIYLERKDNLIEIVLAVLIIAFFSLDHYSCLQFTKTSALLMTTGLIWAVDNYIHERKILIYIFAFSLFYLGVAYRQKGMLPAISYAGMFVLIWWLQNGREEIKGRGIAKEFGILAVLLIVVVAPYGLDKLSDAKNSETEELKKAREYNAERVLVTDYPLMDYEDNKEKFDAIGINALDIHLIDRWILDYDGAASLENLKAINEINRPYVASKMSLRRAVIRTLRKSIEYVKTLNFSGIHIIIVMTMALYIIIVYKSRMHWYVLAIGLLTVALYIAINYMQRAQYRALYLAEESAAFWLLYAATTVEKSKESTIERVAPIILASVVMLMTAPAMSNLETRVNINNAVIETEEVRQYFEDHQDKFFVIPTSIIGMPETYANPLAIPTAPVNVTDTGGWDTLTPYKFACLKRCRGISNPIKDLIDNTNGIFVGDYKVEDLTEYYNKWYCVEKERIDFVRIGKIGGLNLYNVVKYNDN